MRFYSEQEIANLTPGTEIIYHEDGQECLCRVTANTSDDEAVNLGLEAIRMTARNGVYEDIPEGYKFPVMGARGFRHYWGWSVMRIEGTANA